MAFTPNTTFISQVTKITTTWLQAVNDFLVDLGGTAVGKGSSLVAFIQRLTGAVARFVEDKLAEQVSLEDFGAVGNGTTDDTAEITAALASGAAVVYGVPGKTYLVSHTATVTINGSAYRYCIRVPDGVTLDLRGATIKSDAAQNSSVVAMFSSTNVGFVNAVVDCNKANQTTPATGEIAGVLAYSNTRPTVDNIRAINCRQYAGRFLANTGGKYGLGGPLWCTDSDADGWSFGINGTAGELREFDAKIGVVHAENCTQVYGGGYQGGPAIVTAVRTSIESLTGRNCSGGVKLQDSCQDVVVSRLMFSGSTNGGANSGVKIQGNSGASLYPKNVNIGQISVSDAYGNGLRVTYVEGVIIGSYVGRGNGIGAGATGSDQYDMVLDTEYGSGAKSISFASIFIDTPTTVGINTIGSGNVQLGTWFIRGCTGAAFLDAMTGGTLVGDSGRVEDVGSALTWAFRSTGTADGNVGPIDCSAAHSTTQARIWVAAGNYNMSVGPVRLAGGALEGIVTLTNGDTSTSVSNGSAWRAYVGGTSDNIHPEIGIEPIGATARALGSMYAVVADGDGTTPGFASGTGFAIKHAAAGASDKVRYRIGAMSVWSEPAAA